MTTVFDHVDVGGGTFVHYLRQAVADGKLDLTFFSDDIADNQASSVQSVTLPRTLKGMPGGWVVRAWYYHQAVRAAHKLRPFDLVWHNNAVTSLFDVAGGLPVPVVGMINDYNNAESRTPFATNKKFGTGRAAARFGWHQLERYVARRVDRLVVNSEYMADCIGTAYGVDPERIRRLYKGVCLEQFPFRERTRLGNPVRLLFVKRAYVGGGLHDLLHALEKFPVQVALTIVGPLPESHALLETAARRAGLSDVQIVANVCRTDIPEYFKSHDILCIPSRTEALGVAFMEALASGLPVLAANVGGVPEVLDHGRAGWLAAPNDPASVRETLLDMIRNDAERTKKSLHGIKHVRRFTVDSMVDTMAEMASEACGMVQPVEVAA